MKNIYSNLERRGLPGGPNEEINYSSGFSTMGYKRFSPDVNNPFNMINSGRITMKDVDFPVTGIDNFGYKMTMMPGEEYAFPGNKVLEIPHRNLESLQPHHQDHHESVHSFAGITGDGLTHMGAYGGFDTKHFGLEGSFIKPLQKIAHGHNPMSFDLRADYRGGNDRLNFNIGPTMEFHGGHPSFGIQGGLRYRFQPGGELEEDMMYSQDESQPIEEIISNRYDENDKLIKDNYEYKKITDPTTGTSTYQQRRKGTSTWRDAGKEGSTGYRAVTDVFGDDKTGYATSPERARFVSNLSQQYKMQDEDYIRGLMSKANHPLDLVYGNPELGIPAFGEKIKSMPQYRDDFFDPYGDQDDKYFAEYGSTPEIKKAAAQRARQNYLSNVGRTEEEEQKYEWDQIERDAKAMDDWNAERQKTRMEIGRDPYTGNVVPQWEMAGYDNADDYYNYLHTDPTKELLDETGASTVLNVLGIPEMMLTADKISEQGLGAVGKDILNTGADLITAPFVEGDINPLTGEKYWEGATSTMGVMSAIPFVGGVSKAPKLLTTGSKLLNTGKSLGTGTSKLGSIYNKVKQPFSYVNKNIMKKQLLGSNNPAFQKAIDNTFDVTKKFGLSNDLWGAATGYGMYNSMDAINRISSGDASTKDYVKAGLNFIPGANAAKFLTTPTYTTKMVMKGLDKSGLFDDPKNERQITEEANQQNAMMSMTQPKLFQPGGETGRRNLNDLYVSQADLDYLNRAKDDSNEYYCSPGDVGCLASSYNAYDKLVGQRYRSDEFLSEQGLKKSLGLQSLPSRWDSKDYTGYDWDPETNDFVYYDKDVETKRYKPGSPTHDWIMKYKDYFQKGYQGEEHGGGYDFTADSWDIHGLLADQGGQNIYTGGVNWQDSGGGNRMTAQKLKNLYSQMTPGTIIGFNNYNKGLNPKKGLTGSGHSTQVIGYDERGVPVIYDYGDYLPIDKLGTGQGGLYDIDAISNITIPKEHIGKNLEWAKQQGYWTGKDPQDLDLDLNPILSKWYQDDDELPDFYAGLKDEKFNLMDDLNLKESQYDQMAAALIGIAMEETEGGGGFQHSIEQILPGTAGQDTSGLTQLMWSNIADDEKLKKIAEKYGITKQSDLKDSKKSAIASMIYGSRNYLSAQKNLKAGQKAGVRTYYPPGWKGTLKRLKGDNQVYDGKTFITEGGEEIDLFTGNNWSGIGWKKDLEDIQEQLDAASEAEGMPGRYTARKTTDDDGDEVIVIDKKTLGNAAMDPIDAFIYNWNSPYALTSGDAQGGSGYVKNVKSWMDQIQKKQAGGETTPEHVQAKQKTLQEELAKMEQYNLNPAQKMQLTQALIDTYNDTVPHKFRMGGPTLSPELQLYKDYIVGKDESEKARKNYDKLNRVHYREAKLKNMKPANFIMTELIS